MGKKRYIDTVFWDDNYITNLDPSEKLLFIYLITNPNTNISGIYQISLKRISLDTGIEKEMCEKIIGRFQKDDKVFYKDGWIVIGNFIKHQNFNSPFIKTGIERELKDVPSDLIPYIHGIETVLKEHISISQGISQSQGKGKHTIFEIPLVEDIKEYCKKRNNSVNADTFFNFYESKGWMVGKNKMKDWRAAVRTWETNNKKEDKTQPEPEIITEEMKRKKEEAFKNFKAW